MLEFHPICSVGSPLETANSKELENLAVMRDANDQVLGIAISEAEVQDPVVGVFGDAENGRVWFQSENALDRRTRFFFIQSDQIPADALASLHRASLQRQPVNIYALPAQEPQREGCTP